MTTYDTFKQKYLKNNKNPNALNPFLILEERSQGKIQSMQYTPEQCNQFATFLDKLAESTKTVNSVQGLLRTKEFFEFGKDLIRNRLIKLEGVIYSDFDGTITNSAGSASVNTGMPDFLKSINSLQNRMIVLTELLKLPEIKKIEELNIRSEELTKELRPYGRLIAEARVEQIDAAIKEKKINDLTTKQLLLARDKDRVICEKEVANAQFKLGVLAVLNRNGISITGINGKEVEISESLNKYIEAQIQFGEILKRQIEEKILDEKNTSYRECEEGKATLNKNMRTYLSVFNKTSIPNALNSKLFVRSDLQQTESRRVFSGRFPFILTNIISRNYPEYVEAMLELSGMNTCLMGIYGDSRDKEHTVKELIEKDFIDRLDIPRLITDDDAEDLKKMIDAIDPKFFSNIQSHDADPNSNKDFSWEKALSKFQASLNPARATLQEAAKAATTSTGVNTSAASSANNGSTSESPAEAANIATSETTDAASTANYGSTSELPEQAATITSATTSTALSADISTTSHPESATKSSRESVEFIISQIRRYRENAESPFGMNNDKKADELQNALHNAVKNGVVDVRQDSDVQKALAIHRIFGFFGYHKTTGTKLNEESINTPKKNN